ncbi:MAG: hypothetical protein MUF16_00250 [Burkholderiaceae bacterium]|nr:hypothetical protein [Burkholderiaceae bacterium]
MAVRLLRGQTVQGVFYPAFDVLAGLGNALEAALVQGGGATYVNVSILDGEDADAVRLHIVSTAGSRVYPLAGGFSAGSIQFRGSADSAAQLGTLGFVYNADTDAEAAVRLAAGDVDDLSTINGSSPAGVWSMTELQAPCTSVHVGVVGMTPPLSQVTAGPVLQASQQFLKLTFDAVDDVRFILRYEGPPTNFAGSPGTGSARQVVILGVEGPAP